MVAFLEDEHSSLWRDYLLAQLGRWTLYKPLVKTHKGPEYSDPFIFKLKMELAYQLHL